MTECNDFLLTIGQFQMKLVRGPLFVVLKLSNDPLTGCWKNQKTTHLSILE